MTSAWWRRSFARKLGSHRLKAIGKRDIEALHGSLKGTPYQANRVLALLSAMFNFAIESKWRADNPCKGVKKFAEEKRENWLSSRADTTIPRSPGRVQGSECCQLLAVALAHGFPCGGEALHAEWKEFDLTLRRVDKAHPPHKTEKGRARATERTSD